MTPRTPALDRLFGETSLRAFASAVSGSLAGLVGDAAHPTHPPLRGIAASVPCPVCIGSGRPKRRRRRATSEKAARERRRHARAAARRRCRECDGQGYASLDARPRMPTAHGASYEMPDPTPVEVANARAVREMPALARRVGEAWTTADARAWRAREPVTPTARGETWTLAVALEGCTTDHAPLYPLTYAGRLFNDTRHLVYVDQAEAQSRQLLQWAEQCAVVARSSVRISAYPKGEGVHFLASGSVDSSKAVI